MSDDEDGFAGFEAESVDSLHAGVDGLNETGLLERDTVGNTDGAMLDDPVHDANVFGKAAAGGLESGGAADLLVGGALRESFVAAVIALAARDMVENYDAISGMKVGYAGADGGDCAGGFMAEDSRGGVRAGGDFLKIGAGTLQQAAGGHLVAARDAGDRDGFEAHVVDGTIDGRLHAGGDGLGFGLDCVLVGSGHSMVR